MSTIEKAGDKKTTGWPTLAKLLGPNGSQIVELTRKWLGLVAPVKRNTSPSRPYITFPVSTLPDPIRTFVVQGSEVLGCDAAYLALPALTAAAAAIGNARVIRLKRGWDEPSIIWTAIVGDSGTLKSPAYMKALQAVFAKQKEHFVAYQTAMDQYAVELASYKDRKRESKGHGDAESPPRKPKLKCVVCNDTTIEKLTEILQENPLGILVARDELAGWLGSFTRYKGKQGGSDLPNWLEMHRGGTVIYDRKTGDRPTIYVPRATVSITGGIQPGVLRKAVTPEFFEAGLSARILTAMPDKKKKRWTENEIDPEVEGEFHQLLERLYALPMEEMDEDRAPVVLELTTDAKLAWIAFYNSWAGEQEAAEGERAAALSKLEAYAARFALIHHVVAHIGLDSDERRPVGIRSIMAGIELARWFAREVIRIYALFAESDEDCQIRQLVEFIERRGGRITVKQLQNSNSRKYPTSDSARTVLDHLVAASRATWQERPQSATGGPRITDCVLVPTTDDSDESSPDGDEPDEPGGDGPSDETPDLPATPLKSQAENGDWSESSEVGRGSEVPDPVLSSEGRVENAVGGVSLGAAEYQLVTREADLGSVIAAIDQTAVVGLDLETTGLDPRSDQVRLLSLACDTIDGTTSTYVIDCFAVDPTPLWEALAEKRLVIHNAAFDLGFLFRLGFNPAAPVHDTMLLAKLLNAGTDQKSSLAACCARWLGTSVDKSEQSSDWSGPLTESQLSYAAQDAAVLRPLFEKLGVDITEARLQCVADIETRCLPAMVWMGDCGVPFDASGWAALTETAQAESKRLREELSAAAPPKHDGGMFVGDWNWDSPAQVRDALAAAGCEVQDTNDETLASLDHPLATLVRQYREVSKRCTAYGTKWLSHLRPDGRIYPKWSQFGASSGRMSCSDPAMQQFPRGDYRRCVAAPTGRVLVKADYSQIELRIAAKITGDQALLEAYQRGEDLHVLTAKKVLGIDNVTKDHRQLAKALNFGLLYGMGARGFRQYAKTSYGVELTEDQAQQYRRAFFAAYPGLAKWHQRVGQSGNQPIECRTLSGRRVLGIWRFNDKLNAPVQGTGADGLKLAMGLLWERREQVPEAWPVLAVHDEIVVEAPEASADRVAAWLKRAMIDAMAPLVQPVRVEVEVTAGFTWRG